MPASKIISKNPTFDMIWYASVKTLLESQNLIFLVFKNKLQKYGDSSGMAISRYARKGLSCSSLTKMVKR